MIAKTWLEASGKVQPIKLVYTREDDIRGGYYRPAYVHKIKAGVTVDGQVAGWHHRIVGQSILKGTMFEAMLVKDGIDHTSVEGVEDTPYTIDNFSVELNTTDVQVPGSLVALGRPHPHRLCDGNHGRSARQSGGS